MTNTNPAVTAIICTRNRSRALAAALEAMTLLDVDGIPFELLVVDNGSTDDTRAVIEAAAARAPFPLRAVPEPTPGLSRARNRGLAAAHGSLLLFTDDDCRVAPDWVRATLGAFGGDLHQVIGGRVELFDPAQPSNLKRTAMEPEVLTGMDALFGFLHGANFAFGRSVVQMAGRFDVWLGAGTALQAAEDTEFVYRAFHRGIPVRYEPGMLVYHDHGRTDPAEALRTTEGYMVGMSAMLIKSMMAGKTDLAKPIYWGMRGALRRWKQDRDTRALMVVPVGFVRGVAGYSLLAATRRQDAQARMRQVQTGPHAR